MRAAAGARGPGGGAAGAAVAVPYRETVPQDGRMGYDRGHGEHGARRCVGRAKRQFDRRVCVAAVHPRPRWRGGMAAQRWGFLDIALPGIC
mgnify:CR=1 FL=1|jgi:hypothetical protein